VDLITQLLVCAMYLSESKNSGELTVRWEVTACLRSNGSGEIHSRPFIGSRTTPLKILKILVDAAFGTPPGRTTTVGSRAVLPTISFRRFASANQKNTHKNISVSTIKSKRIKHIG
jgi:hypothetical protein